MGADPSNTAMKALKFVKMVATRPPTLLAEFRPAARNSTYLTAVARAFRRGFDLAGVPVRVLPLSKQRIPDTAAKLGTAPRGASRAASSQRVKRPTAAPLPRKQRAHVHRRPNHAAHAAQA